MLQLISGFRWSQQTTEDKPLQLNIITAGTTGPSRGSTAKFAIRRKKSHLIVFNRNHVLDAGLAGPGTAWLIRTGYDALCKSSVQHLQSYVAAADHRSHQWSYV